MMTFQGVLERFGIGVVVGPVGVVLVDLGVFVLGMGFRALVMTRERKES